MLVRRLGFLVALTLTLVVASASFDVATASAQDGLAVDQVEASPKGLIGLGIVGAEIGFIVPAIAGLHEAWAFVVFPVVGAAGGAVAGHFLIDENDQRALSVASLAFGMAMIVPTMVGVLALTAYDPGDEAAPTPTGPPGTVDGDIDAGGQIGGELRTESPARRRQRVIADARRRARAGAGLLRHGEEGWSLEVPGLAIAPERVDDGIALHVPLITGAFQ